MSVVSSLLRIATVLVVSTALVLPTQAAATATPAVQSVAAASHVARATKPFTRAPLPTVTGDRRVGNLLSASHGIWKATPTAFRYQWNRDGKPIVHATAKTYRLALADAGTRITIVTTASRAGFTTKSRTSLAGSPVAGARFTQAPRPDITGKALVGSTLRVATGPWSPAATFLYQWRRGGAVIAGATHSTYTVIASDLGRQIAVTITGRRTGYTSISSTSMFTAVVGSAPPVVVPPVVTPPVVVAPAHPPRPITTDGSYFVAGPWEEGQSVAPATYVASSATADCDWRRLSVFESSPTPVTANGFGAGQKIVSIASWDRAFSTQACGTWTPIDSVTFSMSTSVASDGTFAVHKQLAPGYYSTSTALPGCYWATATDFSGENSSLIRNAFPGAQKTTAYIPENASSFETAGCGVWNLVDN